MKKKAKLAELAKTHDHGREESGHLFVFCADLYRQDMVSEMENTDLSESIESTEKFVVACIDTAALAAQSRSLAAKSDGFRHLLYGRRDPQ